MRLDRVLYTSTVYPANYGFIPRTYADDGDPLDVLVLCNETIYSATLVRCYPIGVIKMIDGGSLDEKIIAIPFDDPTYNNYYDIQELPQPSRRDYKFKNWTYQGENISLNGVWRIDSDETIEFIAQWDSGWTPNF